LLKNLNCTQSYCSDSDEIDSGAVPLDANDNPSEGLNWHVFKAAKDQQEEPAEESK
tara:strand:+ start:874 stop:1041 length:168 start_codon:yes stop_codon:yes gene_type:complete